MGTIATLRTRLDALEERRRPVRTRAEEMADAEQWKAKHMAMSDAEFDEAEREFLHRIDIASESEFSVGLSRESTRGAIEEFFHSIRWERSGVSLDGQHRQHTQ